MHNFQARLITTLTQMNACEKGIPNLRCVAFNGQLEQVLHFETVGPSESEDVCRASHDGVIVVPLRPRPGFGECLRQGIVEAVANDQFYSMAGSRIESAGALVERPVPGRQTQVEPWVE